jgi:hypothetical protein
MLIPICGNASSIIDRMRPCLKTYARRGLDISNKKESPVHQGPVAQTWGMREFYVNDPDGNTLRFRQPIG